MDNYRNFILPRRVKRYLRYFISFMIAAICLSWSMNHLVVAQTNELEGELEIVAEFPIEHPTGNIAITPEGRIIMSQHQFYGAPLRVVEVLEDGSVTPFPNQAWSSEPNSKGVGLNTVLGK